MSDWVESIEESWGANKRVYRLPHNAGKLANKITFRLPSVPGFGQKAMAAPVAEYWEFVTVDELLSIPDVARWALNTDHKRYFMDKAYLCNEFDSGMTTCIGQIDRPDAIKL